MKSEERQESLANISEKGSNTQPEKTDTSIENYIHKIKFHENELISYLSQLAQVYQYQKQWSQAVSCYQKIISLKPKNRKAYIEMGKCLLSINQTNEAIDCYRKAIEIDPEKSFWTYMSLGEAQENQQQIQEAIDCYRKAIDLNPENPQAYFKLGSALSSSGKFDEGITLYLKCIKLNPNFVEAHHKIYQRLHLPGIKISQNILEEIIKCYEDIINSSSQFKKGWILHYLNLGNALSDRGSISEATKWYQVASETQIKAIKPKFVSQYWENRELQKPCFMIVGAMKCGTTSAYQYITQHPKVLPAVVKEVKFFNWNFHKGIEWYLSQFPCFPEEKGFLTGEASPNYLNSPEVPKRVFDYFPNMKLLIFLRNPIDRAISQYHHWVNLGTEKRSLEVAISSELDILEKITDFHPRAFKNLRHNHVGIGLYVYFIENWMKLFKQEQFLILQSDDLNKDPDSVMKNIFEFLDLPEHSCNRYKRHNSRAYDRIDSKLRSRLSNFFKPHNQKLETLLNRQLNWQ